MTSELTAYGDLNHLYTGEVASLGMLFSAISFRGRDNFEKLNIDINTSMWAFHITKFCWLAVMLATTQLIDI